MNSTSYITFSSIDYKGEDSLSSYALKLTPYVFVPDLVPTQHNRVVWDFGDGTTSDSFSASKSYDFPGKYSVNLIVYDCNNNAIISSMEKIITVYDYLNLTFTIECPFSTGYLLGYLLITESGDYILTESGSYIRTDENKVEFNCGKIDGPLTFKSYYPPYQFPSNIYYSVSGSNSNNYWDIHDHKFSHLEKFYTYYDLVYNYSLSSYQYIEIEKIEPVVTKLHAKISNGVIVRCLSSDTGSEYIGMSGIKSVYFKDDSLSDSITTKFWFDKTNNTVSSKDNPDITYLNNLGVVLKSSVIDNPVSKLSITSNGLDGEGYPITSFNINPIKYFNTKIPFMVKIKDGDNMSVKNYGIIGLSSLHVSILSGSSVLPGNNYSLSSLNNTLSTYDHGGSFRGYVEFPQLNSDILSSIRISAFGTFTNDQSVSYTLTGSSNYFDVYSKNYFDLYKMNENFNASQTLKDLRFQEILLDKNVFFDDFLGSLLGDDTYDHETLGVKLYEKIANFLSNTQDIDICDHEFIDTLSHFMGYNDDGEEQYVFPERMRRIIGLASISKNKLIGELNKFRENLDIRGRTSKDEYGINIGDQINTSTYIVSAGTPVVALEKFSNTYNLLNTYQPVSALSATVYPLSAYTSDWGWPLVVPTVFDFKDIGKYYIFFDYVNQYDNTLIGGIVDFDNSNTTISKTVDNTSLFGSGGIFENMLLDTLYQSLSLT